MDDTQHNDTLAVAERILIEGRPVPNAEWVELPPGVRHHSTSAVARSWEAWDALTEEAGWQHRSWPVDASDTYPNGLHTQKEATIRGHRIVVFPPRQPRECDFCHGQPVTDADQWADGTRRPPAECPRCGQTAKGQP